MNSLYALILTDSLHLPTTIGYFNTRPAACQARQSARAWLDDESQSVESLNCFSNAAVNILDECRAAIKAHHNHFVNLRSLALNDPYRIWQPELRQYAVTFYIPYAKCVTYFTAMSTIIAERIVQKTLESAKDVTAFLIPSDHPEYKGIFADRREIPAADLDSITWF